MQQVATHTVVSIDPPFIVPPMTSTQKISPLPKQPIIIYPESDGKPMADNSVQFAYITTFKGNFDIMYTDDPNVFIAGDMLWYPVEGHPEITNAPDVMVALGRPKHDRGSYKQWEEGNIPPQVVFEIWSPSNTKAEKDKKFNFYNRYGVEEYYAFDPKTGKLEGWIRGKRDLEPISDMQSWKSPLLEIKFVLKNKVLELYYPDGLPFLSHIELDQRWKNAENKAEKEAQARRSAENKAKKEAQARQSAENKAKREALARRSAESKAREEVEARRVAEEQARQATELVRQLQEQLRKAQSEHGISVD